jgi:hypothetical protein
MAYVARSYFALHLHVYTERQKNQTTVPCYYKKTYMYFPEKYKCISWCLVIKALKTPTKVLEKTGLTRKGNKSVHTITEKISCE